MDVDARIGAVVSGEFDTFFRDTFPGVARAAALVARDAGVGQELAQEAFFRTFERWRRLESLEHARRFSYRVAINLARSHLRKHLRVTLAGLEPGHERSVRSPDTEEWLIVRDALRDLSGRQRAAVVLVDYVGMDGVEAAEVLGIEPGTLRAHLLRGRRALRMKLDLDEEAHG